MLFTHLSIIRIAMRFVLLNSIARSVFLLCMCVCFSTCALEEEVLHEPSEFNDDSSIDGDLLPQRIERGVYVLSSLDEIEPLFALHLKDRVATQVEIVCLLLLHRPSCAHCAPAMERIEEARRLLMHHYFETTRDNVGHLIAPIFAKLDVDLVGKERLDGIGVSEVPALVFVIGDHKTTITLQYNGRTTTAQDISQTVLHYFYRLMVTAGQVRYAHDLVNVYPRQFPDMVSVHQFVESHQQFFFDFSVVEPALPLFMMDDEEDYVRWLLQEEENGKDRSIHGDSVVLLIQCRHNQSGEENAVYHAFDTMSQLLMSRRDRLFVSITTCSLDAFDGLVVAQKIPLDFAVQEDWSQKLPRCMSPLPTGNETADSSNLVEFMTKVSTPSVMWFDRQATAPIAFPHYRKVHAVLFVDLHLTPFPEDPNMDEKSLRTRAALRQFRQACRNHRFGRPGINDLKCSEDDMVCLLVPSTETRVLTTFDIDIWTPLDMATPEPTTEPLLPVLLITDQRFGGTLRYYLDADKILSSATAIETFVGSFWASGLQPHLKSTSSARTTESGIRILTADSKQNELLQTAGRAHHALLFFTAPTCGHCKRFSVIWNQLADLLNYIEWNDVVKLYQIDVTTQEIVGLNISVRWIPDLYLMTPDRQRIVRFNDTDDLGDDVGRINTATEIIAWLLEKGDFEDVKLQALLKQHLEEKIV
jgi:thiol-disulfide isomerase/thioredoxin